VALATLATPLLSDPDQSASSSRTELQFRSLPPCTTDYHPENLVKTSP